MTVTVEPNFDLMIVIAAIFALAMLSYIWWRFGGPDALAFAVVSGLFTASMDFLSAFVAHNYEYPGQSRLWVFMFILFGWIGMCGSCLFVAEGIAGVTVGFTCPVGELTTAAVSVGTGEVPVANRVGV